MARNQALLHYHLEIVDENDNPITSGLRVTIYAPNGATALTVYADQSETALTNPITSTVFDAAPAGKIDFWYGGGSVDVVINDGIGRVISVKSVTPSMNRIIFDSRLAVSGVLGNITGTDLVDSAGAFVDYVEIVTIDGTLLRPGDLIKISGLIVCDDLHTEAELDVKVEIIEGTNDPLLLHTGDVVFVLDNDYIKFEIDVRIHTVGSSGKIIWDDRVWTNLNSVLALHDGTIEDGVSLAGSTLDLSGDIVITASGDYKNAHADQESQVLWSVQVLKGALSY